MPEKIIFNDAEISFIRSISSDKKAISVHGIDHGFIREITGIPTFQSGECDAQADLLLVFTDDDALTQSIVGLIRSFLVSSGKATIAGRTMSEAVAKALDELNLLAELDGICQENFPKPNGWWFIPRVVVNKKPLVYVTIPHYNNLVNINSVFSLSTASHLEILNFLVDHVECSILTQSFNVLWAKAYTLSHTMGVTHFAMLHADVVPEQFWLDKLFMIHQKTGADVVSVVLPIKDERGLTSTGFLPVDADIKYFPVRRLTLSEVYKLPPTFGGKDLANAGYSPRMVINTGLFLAKLNTPWTNKVVFHMEDFIHYGKSRATMGCISEDWCFSDILYQNGVHYLATREVSACHVGSFNYSNHEVWGSWKTDEEFQKICSGMTVY